MSPEERYARAASVAARRKAEFQSSAAAAKNRLTPARLKQDVRKKAAAKLNEAKSSVAKKAQERPVAVGAAATAFALYLFRRPISALFRRIYVRMTNPKPEESEIDDG